MTQPLLLVPVGVAPQFYWGKENSGARKSLPCVQGGGFCEAKDGGIVIVNNKKTTPQSALLTAPLTQGSLI